MSQRDLEVVQTRRTILALGALGAGSWMIPSWLSNTAAGQEKTGDEKSNEKLAGRIFVTVNERDVARRNTSIAINPNDQTWVKLPEDVSDSSRVSLDGRRIFAYVRVDQGGKLGLAVIDLDGETPPKRIFEFSGTIGNSAFWSPDGKSAVITQWASPGVRKHSETWKCTIDGSSRTKLPISNTERVVDGSSDGKWLATVSVRPPWNEGRFRVQLQRPIYLYRPDGTGERLLIEGSKDVNPKATTLGVRFSPDSQTIMYIVRNRAELDGQIQTTSQSLWLISVDGRERRCIVEGTEDRFPLCAAWSPDGKWLAVGSWGKPAGAGPGFVPIGRGKTSVEIIDLQGKTQKILNMPVQAPIYSVFDWR
jgi:Tol biopolymer transport system component